MIALRPGERLAVGQSVMGEGMQLVYQGDGNLVLYRGSVPVWSTQQFAQSGHTEMQGDGNLVCYDAFAVPYWATATHAPGAWLEMSQLGLKITTLATVWSADVASPGPGPGPQPPSSVALVGNARVIGRSFGDATGPRLLRGCTDFGALRKFHEDQDGMRRQLDVVAQFQQYVRFAFRLNGEPWVLGGLTVDPAVDGWWESALTGYLAALQERGIRARPVCCDFYNWSDSAAEDTFRRVGQISASIHPDLTWLVEAANEMRGTMPGGESDENIARMARYLRAFAQACPAALLSGSDPASQDEAGMRRLAPHPADVALIHDVRWQPEDAIRRAFNTAYENYPDMPISQGEPTGPNGSRAFPYGQRVYQPVNDPNDLLAIYTMHVLTGQDSCYFNDPSLISREPLEATWGFRELPAAWTSMEIPEDIGQGTLKPGHLGDAPLRVVGSHAARADSMVRGDYALGVVSGKHDGQPWAVPSGWDADVTVFRAGGVEWSGRLSAGEIIPIQGFSPAVVRLRR